MKDFIDPLTVDNLCVHSLSIITGSPKELKSLIEAAKTSLSGIEDSYSLLVPGIPMNMHHMRNTIGLLHNGNNSKPSGIYTQDAKTISTKKVSYFLSPTPVDPSATHLAFDQKAQRLNSFDELKKWMHDEYQTTHKKLGCNELFADDLDSSTLIGIIYDFPDKPEQNEDNIKGLMFFGASREGAIASLKKQQEDALKLVLGLQQALKDELSLQVPLYRWESDRGILVAHDPPAPQNN